MKRVGVREFRDHATRYLSGDEVIAVERHGQPIGLYIPTATGRSERSREAIERLDATVRRVVAETGLTEEELSRLFDLRRELPIDDAVRERQREALKQGAGIFKEEDYPYWRTPEDVSRWVHETRRGRPVVPPEQPGSDDNDALSAGQ